MGLRVLVVDDSRLVVAKLKMLLAGMGHEVLGVAGTGVEALRQYRLLMPDVVTMDVTMPEMDGVEATRQLLAEHPNALVLMVTSNGQEQIVTDAINAGAKGYVLKPFNETKLKESLERLDAMRRG